MHRHCVPRFVAAVIGSALGCAQTSSPDPTLMTAGATGDTTTSGSDGEVPSTEASTAADASADDTGSGPEFPCGSVDECRLWGDCCTCVALHRDAPIPTECPADCDRDACSVWGIDELFCGHGCLIKLVECDPAMVTCQDDPPTCDDGFVPSLMDRCWSGHCVPMDLCRP